MNFDHYPTDLMVTEQDFDECGWENTLSEVQKSGYTFMWQALSAAARKAMDEGREGHGKVLWLLADVCSMTLSPKSPNVPFKPIMVMQGERTIIPSDLPESDVTFLLKIVDRIDEPWLKARLADLIWLNQNPRDVKFALAAIDSYRSIPIDSKTWVAGGQQCLERATSLSYMLREGAGERVNEIESAAIPAFFSADLSDGFFAVWLAEFMDTYGLAHDQSSAVAEALESLGRAFNEEGDIYRARENFNSAAKWYVKAENDTKKAEMTVAVAESYVTEAIVRASSEQPSYAAAAGFYEKAIQIYRTIPRAKRLPHRVDERIEELRQQLSEAGERSLGEMGVISTPQMDISEIINNARQSVRGKDTVEALRAFAGLHRGINVDEARKSAKDSLQATPLRAMMAAAMVNRDGRVIAKHPGISVDERSSDDNDPAITAEILQDFLILVGLVVQGEILPALEVLLIEHRLTEGDFVAIANQSPIVPLGREVLFGKALFAGYERDFITALHLLVPQIEHMVRFHLNQSGVKTTNLDSNGIETENGLSTLMGLPETNQIFGEDLAFEIRALFCDTFGPNLRNELAHGLLDDNAFCTPNTVYAWWFGFKLVFNAFWNRARKNGKSTEESQKE